MKLLLFVFALVSLEQLAVCYQGNKTADDDELPDWKTLWQNANFSGTRRTRKPKVSPRRQIFRLRMYPNLSTIMKAFEHATKESVYRLEASKVLTSFEEDCMRDPERRSLYEEERLRKPYIIVEADYIILRRHFVAKLSRRIDAVVMKNPPACLYAHRNLFPYTNNLRSAFFSLGEYAISYNVTMEWQHKPVILSGSWADRASYISCKANLAEGLPPPGDEAYIWPKDLLRPDVLIFLHNSTHVSEIPPTSRHYFRVMQLEWYRRLQGPKVAIVNATNYETREALAVHAIKLIQEIAGNETDVSNIPKRVPKHTYRPKSQRKRTYKTRKWNSSTTTTVECQSVTGNAVTNELRPGNVSEELLGHQKYTTLESLLNEFQNGNLSKNNQITDLVMSHYKYHCFCPDRLPQTAKHKIFVAVESNSVSTRQILAARYSKHLGADVYRVMPKCLQRVRKYFNPDHPLLDAFYLLGVYVATMQMSKRWGKDPTIVTGSWIDKAAHMIARRYSHELPPPESPVYKLSAKDLIMPDIIFYAFFADDVHRTPETTRPPNAWKHRVTEIFRRMEGPPLFILDCKIGFEAMVRQMINHTLNTLNDTYDLKSLWPYWDQLRKPQNLS